MHQRKSIQTTPTLASSSNTDTSLCKINKLGRLSSGLKTSSKVPKIRKVNEYIIYFDEVLGKGQFGTVVKA